MNQKACAVKLPCARSHSNASKLDAVLAKQCFTQYLVATRDVSSPSNEENKRADCANACICARRTTDRDLESQRHEKGECLDMCTTDDPL